jgi:hypothetical protein
MKNENQQLTPLLDLVDAYERLKYAQKSNQVVSKLRMQELDVILSEILFETSDKMHQEKVRLDIED